MLEFDVVADIIQIFVNCFWSAGYGCSNTYDFYFFKFSIQHFVSELSRGTYIDMD
jgi:hypothetical protein